MTWVSGSTPEADANQQAVCPLCALVIFLFVSDDSTASPGNGRTLIQQTPKQRTCHVLGSALRPRQY